MKIAGTAGGICPYVGGLQSVYFLEAYKGGAVMLKEMLALSDKGARDLKKVSLRQQRRISVSCCLFPC